VDALLVSHSDLRQFMISMNPDLQVKYARCPERAVLCNAPTLTVLDQAYGEGAAAQWLVPQITALAVYAGVKDRLEQNQYEQLAQTIVTNYGDLKASELMLFFQWFKSGRYGRFYGAIDPMLITEALRKFKPERDLMLDEKRREDARRERDAMYDSPLTGKAALEAYKKSVATTNPPEQEDG